MSKNSSGKILTLFLVIIAVLLVSTTAISIFFFQKEIELRQVAEVDLERSQNQVNHLDEEARKSKKQIFLLEEKNKEADEKINGLLDELDLSEAVKEEIKKEKLALEEQIDKEIRSKEQLQDQLAKISSGYDEKITELKNQLELEISRAKEIEKVKNDLGATLAKLKDYQDADSQKLPVDSAALTHQDTPKVALNKTEIPKINLDQIVVAPPSLNDGRVLSVDPDTEFVIVNVGKNQGIDAGKLMSVFRGPQYLGDIKVTRTQPDMAAADIIPPFSSHDIRKNDQVKLK